MTDNVLLVPKTLKVIDYFSLVLQEKFLRLAEVQGEELLFPLETRMVRYER